MRNHATIKDIARALNISKSTVSRALANHYDVKAETKDAVMAMALKMNYKPNPYALNLINRRTKTIGVVVPEFINSFFPRIIIQIQKFFEQEGFNVFITQSNESAESEKKNLQLLEGSMVEGIIISVAEKGINREYYKNIIDNGTPLVFFNRAPADMEGIDASCVVIDDYAMAFFAVEHLILGPGEHRRNIIHLEGPKNINISNARYNGYRDALQKYNIEVCPQFIIECKEITRQHGYNAMIKCLDDGIVPEAVFGFNDQLAIGAMKALKSRGYKIPQQVAIMGFSESQSALLTDPPLSSVAQPLDLMGRTTARLLLDKIENPDCESKIVVLDAKINIRESSDCNAISQNI